MDGDSGTFELSVVVVEEKVDAVVLPAAATENGNKDSRNSSRIDGDKKSKKARKTSSSNSIQPLIINTPLNTPLGIDIDMIIPLVSWVQWQRGYIGVC